MGTNLIDSSMIRTGLSTKQATLDKYILDGLNIPLSMFGTDINQSISASLDYLASKRCGTVEIPANENNKSVLIRASVNKSNRVVINYITSNYRFPINQESRPYNGGSWEVGDIIINNDLTDSKCLGWVCIEEGTPGDWISFSYMKKWFTQVEKVEELPEPSAMQEGRQLICKTPEGLTFMYYCACTDPESNTYTWVKQNIFESDIEDKIEELFSPKWDELMHDLDENLAVRIGPAISLYFQDNPIPIIKVVTVETEENNWKVTELENSTPYDNLPPKFLLMMSLPSKSVQGTKLNLLDHEFSIKSYSNNEVSDNELAEGVLVLFNIDKNNACAYYSSGSRVADNNCYLNINLSASNGLTGQASPEVLSGVKVIVTSQNNPEKTFYAYTNSIGSCSFELEADDYTLTVDDLQEGYILENSVKLARATISGKTTMVPMNLVYNRGKLTFNISIDDNLNEISQETFSSIAVRLTSEGFSQDYTFERVGITNTGVVTTEELDAAKDYTATLIDTSDYKGTNTTSYLINGSSIRGAIVTKEFSVQYIYGKLDISVMTFDNQNKNVYLIATPTGGSGLEPITRQASDSGSATFLLNGEATSWSIVVDTSNLPRGYAWEEEPYVISGTAIKNSIQSTNFNIIEKLVIIQGVRIDISNSDPEGSVTYIEDSVGKTPGSLDWMEEWPFNAIFPVVVAKADKHISKLNKFDITQLESGDLANITSTTQDCMSILPTIWYKFTTASGNTDITITNVETEGYTRFPYDTQYSAAGKGMFEGYVSGDVLCSVSGKTPTTSQTRSTFRDQAAANGVGFCQNTFEIQLILEILFLLYYKNRNSQEAVGNGNCNNSNYLNTGTSKARNTGSIAHHAYGNTNLTTAMKFLWIENFWGNYHEFVDGLTIVNYVAKVCYDLSKFDDIGTSSSYTKAGQVTSNSGYADKLRLTNLGGFLPTSASGSNTTHWCDYAWVSSGTSITIFGGDCSDGTYCGAFCWGLSYGAPYSSSSIASRLCMYLTEDELASVQ